MCATAWPGAFLPGAVGTLLVYNKGRRMWTGSMPPTAVSATQGPTQIFWEADPTRFGLGPDVRGWWFIRNHLQLDLAALSEQPDSGAVRSRIAAEPRLQMPDTVTCFSPALGPHPITIVY